MSCGMFPLWDYEDVRGNPYTLQRVITSWDYAVVFKNKSIKDLTE